MASVLLTEKLNLSITLHPSPYNLRWLNKGGEIQVNRQCLIAFSIGKNYKDEVFCDVVPMDAYHLLLGKPW